MIIWLGIVVVVFSAACISFEKRVGYLDKHGERSTFFEAVWAISLFVASTSLFFFVIELLDDLGA